MNIYELKCNMVSSPNLLRKYFLTDDQIKIMRYIAKERSVHTDDIVKKFDLTVQNACTKLRKLHEAGYLSRKQETHPSGGICYVWYSMV